MLKINKQVNKGKANGTLQEVQNREQKEKAKLVKEMTAE